VEAALFSRRFIVLCVLLGVLVVGLLWWPGPSSHRQSKAEAGPVIDKHPVIFANRTFDPDSPPADMPPLAPGEQAECDSNFSANASVGGEARQTDATNALVTITQVKVALQLNITIWVPANASQHVIEHEDGHREISEYFYETADKLAAQIAAKYLGKEVLITGTDLHAELSKLLQQIGKEITDEYGKELNPEPTQLRFDDITDHGRNDTTAKDAIAQALKDAAPASSELANNPKD
jgi:hypothetical protein